MSKVKWVGLGEVCEFQVGLPVSSKDQFKKNIDNRLQPLIKIKNMCEAGINIESDLSWIDTSAFKKIQNFVVYPGEILIAKDATIGRVALNNTNQKLYFSQHIYKFKPNLEVINQRYLFYALLLRQKKLSELKTSGPIPALELSRVKQLKIPLPSLEQQEKIANWLDTFSSLERQLERHKSQYRYYLNLLMRGGQRVKLGDVCEFLAGLSVPSSGQFEKNINGNLEPIIRVNDLQNFGINCSDFLYIDPAKYSKVNQCKAKPRDILIVRWGSAGKLACNDLNREIIFSKNICKVEPNLVLINQRYLFYALIEIIQKNIHLIRHKAVIPTLNLPNCKQLKIPYPSLEKQQQIADWLDKFRELTNSITKGLPKEILLLKKQSQYYRERLIG